MEMGDDPLGLLLVPKPVKDSSLRPPAHGRDVDKKKESRPPWVLLDKTAYLAGADVRNATTATSKTREGHEIQVTLCTAARPPLVSYMCVHSPTLNPSDDFAREPKIIGVHDDLLLFRLTLGHGNRLNLSLSDYFVYQAASVDDDGSRPPSLTRITHPGGNLFPDTHVGILHDVPHHHPLPLAMSPHNPHAKQHYIVAALTPTRKPGGEYRLHLYHATTKQWTTKLLQLGALPPSPPLTFFFHHTDKRVASTMLSLSSKPFHTRRDTQAAYIADGWTAAKWSWIAESGCWRMDCRLRSSQIPHHMVPTLPNYSEPQPDLEKLHVGHPVLSLHDTHLVYLMAKIEDRAHKAWILPINLKDGVIQEPADFAGADRTSGISETYVQTTISIYPQTAPTAKKRKQKLLGSSSKRRSETHSVTNVVLPVPGHGGQKLPDAGRTMETEFPEYMFLG
uniref:Uncharacterized protein n=1 Tax=Oryza meridionalis TaxID=40149 RepID=A0A0E0CG52_9ORYZ